MMLYDGDDYELFFTIWTFMIWTLYNLDIALDFTLDDYILVKAAIIHHFNFRRRLGAE